MAKRGHGGTSHSETPCAAAPVTPFSEERPEVGKEIANTPTKSQKRRKRMQRVTIIKSQIDVITNQPVTNSMLAFTGGVFSRLDRIEYMVSSLFCSMVNQGVDQCLLPEQLPAMRADAVPFVPASEPLSTPTWEPIPDTGTCSFVKDQSETDAAPPSHATLEASEVNSDSSGATLEFDGSQSCDGALASAACPASAAHQAGSAPIFDETVLKMYELCSEEDGMGSYSRMDATSKERVQQIRSELWDHFALLGKLRGLDPTPESLSSSAGCLPSMFSDSEPNLTEFAKIVEEELSMM